MLYLATFEWEPRHALEHFAAESEPDVLKISTSKYEVIIFSMKEELDGPFN